MRTPGLDPKARPIPGAQERIAEAFNAYFRRFGIRLAAEDVAVGNHRMIAKRGWSIAYRIDPDSAGLPTMEFYATNRMTDDRHLRIGSDGRFEPLQTIRSGYGFRKGVPGAEHAAREASLEHNQRVAKELVSRGLYPYGDINTFLRTEGAAFEHSSDEPGAGIRPKLKEEEATMGTAAEGNGQASLAHRLQALGVTGVLVQMAKHGQLLELKCEMPTCYCPKGPEHFDPWPTPKYANGHDWSPNADHYPTLRKDGGKLQPSNVRLAHVFCNNTDFGWRSRIRAMLEKNPTTSFEEIAEALNRKKDVQPPPGAKRWTAEVVRRAYRS